MDNFEGAVLVETLVKNRGARVASSLLLAFPQQAGSVFALEVSVKLCFMQDSTDLK